MNNLLSKIGEFAAWADILYLFGNELPDFKRDTHNIVGLLDEFVDRAKGYSAAGDWESLGRLISDFGPTYERIVAGYGECLSLFHSVARPSFRSLFRVFGRRHDPFKGARLAADAFARKQGFTWTRK